jgi:hypothetical protein
MAPMQASMSRFLYESRVPDDDAVGFGSEVDLSASTVSVGFGSDLELSAPVLVNADCVDDSKGSQSAADVACSSQSDCIVLNAISTPAKAPAESDVQILDPTVGSPLYAAVRQRRQSYEQNRHWQDSWAAKLPWAESVLGRDGCVTQVRCRICSEVEGREKLLAPKIDGLWKHAGRRRALTNFGGVKKGEHYFLATNQHVKNEKRYFARVGETIAVQFAHGAVKERKRKLVQFRLLFWILSQGRPMSDFEDSRELFQQLQVPDCPRKHWSAFAGWDMAESMSVVLANHTKKVISQARFFAISADEVTTIDHESWLSVHIYVCIGFKRVSIMLGLFRLVEGNGATAVKEAISTCISWQAGFSESVVAERLVCFGADGVSVFQGARAGVTQQLKQKDAPFLIGVHCMAHRTNLAVEPLSNLPMVEKLETLCQALYNYFTMSSKKHLEFQKLADIVETEGRRLLKNVKTRWISLLEPLRRVLAEYKTLVVKMCEDSAVKEPALIPKQQASRESAKRNLDLLCDISTLLTLPCLMPLLDSVVKQICT